MDDENITTAGDYPAFTLQPPAIHLPLETITETFVSRAEYERLQVALAAEREKSKALAAALEGLIAAVDALEVETHRTFSAEALIEELESDQDRYDVVYAALWKECQQVAALQHAGESEARE